MNIKSNLSKLTLLIAVLFTMTFYVNCTKRDLQFEHPSIGDDQTSGPGPDTGTPGGNDDIVAIAGVRTASILSANRLLASFVQVAGVNTPTADTVNSYNRYKTTLSLDGSANSPTPPMLMAISNVAAEVCDDLVAQEKALVAANRRIFNSVNFATGPAQINAAVISDTVRRMARSFWGRNETAEELTALTTGINEAKQGQTAVAQTDIALIYACTGMLSSLSAIEM
ncbi:MAG: hypothetical protein ABL958_07085 [Bdellovibrionia bacterium]